MGFKVPPNQNYRVIPHPLAEKKKNGQATPPTPMEETVVGMELGLELVLWCHPRWIWGEKPLSPGSERP